MFFNRGLLAIHILYQKWVFIPRLGSCRYICLSGFGTILFESQIYYWENYKTFNFKYTRAHTQHIRRFPAYSVIKVIHHDVHSHRYNKRFSQCFSSLLCKARADLPWFGMMPESHFNIWAFYIIINHDDDALFNIHGTSQQFLLATSLNSWIGSRKINYYSVAGEEAEAYIIRDWGPHWKFGVADMKTYNLVFYIWIWYPYHKCSYACIH